MCWSVHRDRCLWARLRLGQVASATLFRSLLGSFCLPSYRVRGQLWTEQTPGPLVQQEVSHLQEGVLDYFVMCPACSLTFSYGLKSSQKLSPLPN